MKLKLALLFLILIPLVYAEEITLMPSQETTYKGITIKLVKTALTIQQIIIPNIMPMNPL